MSSNDDNIHKHYLKQSESMLYGVQVARTSITVGGQKSLLQQGTTIYNAHLHGQSYRLLGCRLNNRGAQSGPFD